MGLFGQLLESAGEKIAKDKEQRAREERFVRENPGTKAICAYFAQMFDKGSPGYNWLKQNREPLYPVINQDSVSLCYMKAGDGQSWSGIKSKDIEVSNYTFAEMYQWYGLSKGEGYAALNSRTERNTLEQMINAEVQKLPHIKYNGGYLVRMFQ